MGEPGIPAPSSLVDCFFRMLLKTLQRNNVLYLVSAFFMLVGCYLICLPHLFEFNHFSSLLKLLSVVNCYELMVIGACVYVLRFLPACREGRTLIVVEVLFLFDATLTNNSCLSANYSRGLVVLAVALGLACIKIFALETASRSAPSLFGASRGVLLAALFYTYSFQAVLAAKVTDTTWRKEFAAHLVWLGLGALPLFVRRPEPDVEPAAVSSSAEIRAVFHDLKLQRVIALLALLLPALHVSGQSWVHRMPVEVEFLVPLVIALAIAADEYYRAEVWSICARVAAIGLLSWNVFSSVPDSGWSIKLEWLDVFFTPTRLNLSFAALAFGTAWLRTGRTQRLDLGLALLCGMLAIAGGNAAKMSEFALAPNGVKLVGCLILCGVWCWLDRTYWRVATLTLANGLLLFNFAGVENPYEILYYAPLVLLVLSLPFKSDARWAMCVWLATFACGCWRAAEPTTAAIVYGFVVFAALAVAYLLFKRSALLLLVAYTVIAVARRIAAQSDGGMSWGWLAIVLAFGLFILAFYVTRTHLAGGGAPSSTDAERASSTLTSL